MSPLDAVRRDLFSTEYADDYSGASWSRCLVCDDLDGQHEDGCITPRIVAALEDRELMVTSMARVWGAVQGTERADYKQYVEMGDILYHATDGRQGACGRYDGPPCRTDPEKEPA